MSLRIKLIWPYLFVITAIFLLNQGYLYSSVHQSLQRERVKDVRLLTFNISNSIKVALETNDKLEAQRLLNELLVQEAVAEVVLFNKDNKSIVSLHNIDGNSTSEDSILTLAHFESANQRYIVEPIVHNGHMVATLGIALTNQLIFQSYETLLKSVAALLTVLLITGGIFYIYIGRIIVQPLRQLHDSLENLAHETTNYVPINPHTKGELGELIHSFDLMMVKFVQREKLRLHSLENLKRKSSIAEDVLESIQYSLIITNNLGTIIHCNSATYSLFNKNNHTLLNTNIRDLINTKSSSEFSQILEEGLERSEIKLSSIDSELQYSLTSRFLSKQGHVLFEVRDITELEDVRSRERIAGRVFANSQDGLIVINEKGAVTMANPAVTTLLEVEVERLIGQRFLSLIHSQKLRKMLPGIIKSIEHYGIWQGEVVELKQSGQFIPLFAKVNRILKCEYSESYDYVIVLSDLSDVKEMERLEYLTHHDPLTGLANRSKLNLVLEKLVQRSAYVRDEFALLYLDLDGFKAINDTYGHDAGDAVLKIVADRMTTVTRDEDLIVRLGGDEFVVVINPANHTIVTRVTEQLLESISSPILYKGNTLNVGVSIGVKIVDLYETDAERVLKSADTAMYQAKKSGKGRVILMGNEL